MINLVSRILALSTLVLNMLFGTAQEPISDTIWVQSAYSKSTAKPIIINKNSVVYVYADSLYLINNIRYDYYEELREFINDKNNFNNNKLISKYEKMLRENELAYNKLINTCKEGEQKVQQFLADTDTLLQSTKSKLEQTKRSLNDANTSLNLAQSKLKKSKKKQIGSAIGASLGGVSIGLLIGILVSR